ncbi:hypothetical protein FK216_04255 [Moraxellaceae bacterium AER2_44_116]|nr:hypothetical protein [Moraxellaceae bacterium]TQC98746.1 hypothetical protein FK216_04255 [Moraxellaceae bacterium AER2_44_116]
MKTLTQHIRVTIFAFLLVANTIYADTNKTNMTVTTTVISGCSISSPSVMTLGATAQLSCSTGSHPSVYNMPIQLISHKVNSYIEVDQLVIITVIDF